MLIEDADEQGNADLRAELEGVHGAAYETVRLLGEILPQSLTALDPQRLAQLQQALRVPVNRALARAQAISSRPEPFLSPPIQHIVAAAAELAEFVAHASVATSSTGRHAPEERARAAGAKVLVADDSDRNRELLALMLERQGYSVTAVSNGAEALEMLRRRAFDLVLLDVIMPVVDGFDGLERIKADPQLRDLPVIMMSASDEYASVIRCIESGAEDYLPKPFDPVLLRARLKASLEKKALRDEQHRKTEELERAYRDLQQAQDALITQEKLASLGSLAAGIAHEIKNPLNFVTNFAALSADLLSELRDALQNHDRGQAGEIVKDLASNLQRIQEHGKRADRIVRGMLGHARRQPSEREKADLNALVTDSANLAYHSMRSQDMSFNVSIRTDLDPAIGRVTVFPQDLSRALLNIATNAFYAVQEKRRNHNAFSPTVEFDTRLVGGSVEIRVRDNGCGIPFDIQGRVFEPFFTTKPAGSGTGLGLSITHDIVVKEHGGSIQVNSVPGEWTEFIISVPTYAEPAA
jgi:signal transduction histidine kinase